ncbi:hypothetical protein HFN60_30065 [Rhizobium leguminosarum]|uniref:hypothetical protein n=1 Tax=Rhizobium leguminosarum TaxID=384 RepID=UPI001C94D5BD|nr:hypothetical protein [Rhizobium leguminosarum]MBY5819841.1 hypothetical protein [Rhizobium leguminosarum]
MNDQSKQYFKSLGKPVLVVLMVAALFYHEWIVAFATLISILAWNYHYHFRYDRASRSKTRLAWLSVDQAVIALLLGVPLFLGAYSQLNEQGHPSASQLSSYERTFEVLCLKWRDGNWFDRNIGQYRDRRWCKDYVHRLPGADIQAVASETTAVQLWK